jgi:hypothetical protein
MSYDNSDRNHKLLSRGEIAIVEALSLTVSLLSIFGCVFMLLCYWRFKSMRKFAFKLVAILSATDVAAQLFNFVSPTGKNMQDMQEGIIPISNVCYAQAVGDSFFELSRCGCSNERTCVDSHQPSLLACAACSGRRP